MPGDSAGRDELVSGRTGPGAERSLLRISRALFFLLGSPAASQPTAAPFLPHCRPQGSLCALAKAWPCGRPHSWPAFPSSGPSHFEIVVPASRSDRAKGLRGPSLVGVSVEDLRSFCKSVLASPSLFFFPPFNFLPRCRRRRPDFLRPFFPGCTCPVTPRSRTAGSPGSASHAPSAFPAHLPPFHSCSSAPATRPLSVLWTCCLVPVSGLCSLRLCLELTRLPTSLSLWAPLREAASDLHLTGRFSPLSPHCRLPFTAPRCVPLFMFPSCPSPPC